MYFCLLIRLSKLALLFLVLTNLYPEKLEKNSTRTKISLLNKMGNWQFEKFHKTILGVNKSTRCTPKLFKSLDDILYTCRCSIKQQIDSLH